MTTGAKVGITLAVLVALAAALYSFSDNRTPNELANATSTEEGGKKMSFGDFAMQKGTFECAIDERVAGIDTKGTIFMDKGMIRGDLVQSTSTTTPLTSSFIIRDGYVYYWNTVLPQGIKMKYAIENYKAGDFSQFDQVDNYNCKEWTVDASKFKVPTNVTFQQMN